MPSTSASRQQPEESELRIPYSRESEAAILGNLMLDFENMAICRRMQLSVGDFFVEGHRAVYRVMHQCQEEFAGQLDPIALVDHLKRAGSYDRAGGHAGVAALLDGVPRFWHSAVFESHVRRVKEASRRRLLMASANRTITEVADGERSSREIAREMQRMGEELQSAETEPPIAFSHLVSTARARLNDRINKPRGGSRSGFDGLDSLTGGLQPGHLCVVAARPRIGKSTFALHWLINVLRVRQSALMVSFEMSAEEITDRLLMLKARIEGRRFLSGMLTPEEWTRFTEAENAGRDANLHIRDHVESTLPALAAEARATHQQEGIDLLVIDYLGLMQGRGENRVADLSEITRGLKLLARDLEIPIVCLAQLNRQIESRGKDKPRLSDLRESGSIEQDADQVIFLTRDLESEQDITDATIILEKNRHGRNGQVSINFDRRIGGFLQ